MARYTPPGSLSSVPAINAELEKISEAFEDTLSRQGDTPNQMEADLDLNGNSLLNVKSDPNNPNSVLSRGEAYDKSETDALLDEHLSEANTYTDVREAAIRADFLEDAAGPTGGLLTRAQLVASSLNASAGTTILLVDGTSWEATGDTGVPSQDIQANGTLTDANGDVWRIISGSIDATITVGIPSDFPTLQDAIDFYHNKVTFNVNRELVLNIEAGHQITSGINVSGGDYGYIRITSDDATVQIDGSWGTGGALIADNARAPVLDCIIDLNSLVTSSGYYLNNTSNGFITPGSGMINGLNRGAHVSNKSSLSADDCVFTGFGQAGIHASRTSDVQCANANLSGNSQDPTNTFGALYASRSSRIHGPSINLTNSGGDGVRVQRLGTIVVPDIDVSGCAGIAFVANGGDIMSDSGNPVTDNLQGQLINAGNNGRIYLGEANATFVAGMTDFAIECRQGTVYVRDLTMSGQEGICIYAIGAGAKVDCPTYTVTSGQDGVNCLDLAEVNIERCNITGQTRYGVSAASGAKVTVEDGTVSGSVNNDLNCLKGAQIFAFNATTSSGAVNVADTNFSAFNTIESNKGIIWA